MDVYAEGRVEGRVRDHAGGVGGGGVGGQGWGVEGRVGPISVQGEMFAIAWSSPLRVEEWRRPGDGEHFALNGNSHHPPGTVGDA